MLKAGKAPGPIVGLQNSDMQYPATWDMIEDEELPLLDRRLVQTMQGPAAQMALDRLSAMVATRRLRRLAAHDEVAKAMIGTGLDPLAIISPQRVSVAAGHGGLSGERRREGWSTMRELFAKVGSAFGKERRMRSLRGELLVHAIGLEVLSLLEGEIKQRRYGDGVSGVKRSVLLDRPAVAALASLFSGFNAAYLLPQHAFQAELLAAAAWLGWKSEGCHAPLPAAAARYLEQLGEVRSINPAKQDVLDPQFVLRFALDISGVSPGSLHKHAHEEWPSSPASIDLRPKGPINEPLCMVLLDVLESGGRQPTV